MADIPEISDVSSGASRDQLQARRTTLRRRRRLSLGQSLWRWVAMAGLTGAVFWGTTQPVWLIHSSRQIQVSGNERLSDEAVQALVPLDYPQSLLKVEPEDIAQQLQQRAPILEAKVSRQLFPPGLKVQVQERVPVAVVLPATGSDEGEDTAYLQAGFIDAQGAWMPKSSFGLPTASDANLPTLRLRGLQPQYQRYWPQIYATLRSSPVAIQEVDWHDPSNLVLQTDLGVVYLGSYSPDLERQLATLDQMRHLSEQVGPSEVAHIDLTNPSRPALSLAEPPKPEAD
ncbi:MAG: FtsQ-type POTRA domain-containing protein [Leptolyngbya sp.]|nr:FtsQ-type POTRA domain-containing protein [Leptolyngbya sp.]